MVLSFEQLSRYAHGHVQAKLEEESWIRFLRFHDHQIEHFRYEKVFFDRCYSSSGIYLEFDTNTTSLSFRYRLDRICSFDTIDLWVNGALIKSQSYSFQETEGVFEVQFPAGGKRVRIVLPLYSSISLSDFTLDDDCNAVPVKEKGKRVLVLGDSITQGNGAQTSSCSYIWTLKNTLGWNVLNQALGGYSHDANGLLPIDFQPEAVLVAFGANNFTSSHFREKAEAFYQKLTTMYPGLPVFNVSPIWIDREDNPQLWDARDCLKEILLKYPNIQFYDGLSLVPHRSDFYMDGTHPARHGHLMYGAYLATAILRNNK